MRTLYMVETQSNMISSDAYDASSRKESCSPWMNSSDHFSCVTYGFKACKTQTPALGPTCMAYSCSASNVQKHAH